MTSPPHRAVRFLPALALLLAAPALAQAVDDPACVQRPDTYGPQFCEVRTVALPARDTVRVDGGPNGGVTVTAWDGDGVEVRAVVRTYGESEAVARRRAEAIELQTDGTIRAADVGGAEGGRWVSLAVRVPHGTAVDVVTNNGGITVEGVSDWVRVRSQNGGLRLVDVGGDVRGRTANGSVAVVLTEGEWYGAGLDVETANGSVRLVVPEGYNGRVETGTLWGRVENETGVAFTTDDGRRLALTLGRGGPLVRAVTTSGSVRVTRG